MRNCIRLSTALLSIVAVALSIGAMAPANGSLTFETWTEQCQRSPDMIGCPFSWMLGLMPYSGEAAKAPSETLATVPK
jgi:hypothetical protein